MAAGTLTGNGLANVLNGASGADVLNGAGGSDTLVSNGGNDTFVFVSGQASGDVIVDFAGNGAAAGDSLQFVGFGTLAQGASFTQVGATNQWQIHSALDGHNEVITLQNSALVNSSDYLFLCSSSERLTQSAWAIPANSAHALFVRMEEGLYIDWDDSHTERVALIRDSPYRLNS